MQISREYLECEMTRKRSGTSVTRGDVLRQPFDTWSSAKTSLRVSMSPFGRSLPRFEIAVPAVPVKTTFDQLTLTLLLSPARSPRNDLVG